MRDVSTAAARGALNKVELFVIAITVVAIGAFYFLTIREGHDWGSDFAQYIHHAKNIVEHVDYRNTGYIYNPHFAGMAPRTTPPVFPILLSPLYKCFGLNLKAMKIEVISLFLGFLLIFSLIFRNRLPFRYLLSMVIVIGFNPSFWDFKDQILSDLPFLFFAYLSFLFMHYAYESQPLQKYRTTYAFITGIVIYFAYGTREAGIVLLLTLFVYRFMETKIPVKYFLLTAFAFFALAIPQWMFLHDSRDYLALFTVKPKIIIENFGLYYASVRDLWQNGYNIVIPKIIVAITFVLALIGYVSKDQKEMTLFKIFRIFPVLYLVLILVLFPYFQARYLFPLVPLYILYIFMGIRKIGQWNPKFEKYVFVLLMGAILFSYAAEYATLDYGPIAEGIEKRESVELFDYIRKYTDKNDIFIFRKPRVLSLFTGRQASVYHYPVGDKNLWDYFREIHAHYVIVGRPFPSDSKYLRPFVAKYGDNLENVFSNADFDVYRVKY